MNLALYKEWSSPGEGGGAAPLFGWDRYNVCAAVQDMVSCILSVEQGVFLD